MAIKVGGTIVVDDARSISNVVDANFTGTSAIRVPTGTTEEQPSSPESGMVRFNTTTNLLEVYDGINWKTVGPSFLKQYYLASY